MHDHGFGLISALNADWDDLVADQEALSSLQVADSTLGDCADLNEVLAAIRGRPDEILAWLIAEDHRGNQLAGRVVLQAMLGKIISMAARDRWAGIGDYVSHFWVQLRTYPLARRPQRIAANLALDTLKAAVAERAGRAPNSAPTLAGIPAQLDDLHTRACQRETLDHSQVAGLSAPRVIGAAGALGLVDSATAELLFGVYAEGQSGQQIAARFRLTPNAVRLRCSKAVRRLADHSAELIDAA